MDNKENSVEDVLKNYQLSKQGIELIKYALNFMDKGYRLPLSWWQDHIVPTYDEKLERILTVSGPVFAAHEIDIFDSWKKVCSTTHIYAGAAASEFQSLMDRARHVLRVLPPTRPVATFRQLAADGFMDKQLLCFLRHVGFVRVIDFQHSDDIQIGLAQLPRSWYFNLQARSLDDSFALWRDQLIGELDHKAMVIMISDYLVPKTQAEKGEDS